MELSELLRALRRHWLVAFLAFALCVLVGGAAAYGPANTYSATTTVEVQPTPGGSSDPGAFVGIVQALMPQLAVVADSTSVERAARRTLSSDVADAPATISAKGDPGTAILSITVESSQQGVTAALANAVAGVVKSREADSPVVTMTVLDQATPPGAPANSRLPLVVGGVVLGLIAAVFAAVVAASLRRRLDRAEEIRQRFGTSVIGEIPRLRRSITSPQRLFDGDEHPDAVEAFYRLQTNIMVALLPQHSRAVLLTSCRASEGKTTVTSCLAWVLASSDNPVVAMDADLRRPALHQALDRPFGPGVSDCMAGDVRRFLQPTALPTLQFLPAGTPSRHPAEILSVALPRILDAVSTPMNLTLVDAPPIAGAAETVLMSAMTRSVVLVVDVRRNQPEDIERVLVQLRDAGADVLGVVLNRVRFSRARRTAERYYHVARNDDGSPGRTRRRLAHAGPTAVPSPTPATQAGPTAAAPTTTPAPAPAAPAAPRSVDEPYDGERMRADEPTQSQHPGAGTVASSSAEGTEGA